MITNLRVDLRFKLYMMGKMTRLYLSISLARIPHSRVGGFGGSAGVASGSSGARVSEHTCARSVLSRGSVSAPSFTVHVSMQHVWNLTHACKDRNNTRSVESIESIYSFDSIDSIWYWLY